nr:DNA/RNA helicase domain-containing protein [Rothia nasimurium]
MIIMAIGWGCTVVTGGEDIIVAPWEETKSEKSEFIEQILNTADQNSKVWIDLDLPSTPIIDCYLVDPNFGTFIIEIISKPIDKIEEYTLETYKSLGQLKPEIHPLKKSLRNSYKIREKFALYGLPEPWTHATVAFPKIKRADFIHEFTQAGFEENDTLLKQIKGMIFLDDLENSETLKHCLSNISRKPPAGTPRPKNFEYSPLQEISNAIDFFGNSYFPGIIFNQDKKYTWHSSNRPYKRFFTPSNRGNVVIEGKAGTGKTRALLDISINHATAGREVLLTCFNKVLASEIQMLLDTIENINDQVKEKILVTDFYNFRKFYKTPGNKVAYSKHFGTICIDESQDLIKTEKDGQLINLLDFLSEAASDAAEWFFAYGKGQELYGTTPQKILDITADNPHRTPTNNYQALNRTSSNSAGYRNSAIAESIEEAKGNPDKALTELLKRFNGKASGPSINIDEAKNDKIIRKNLLKNLDEYIQFAQIHQDSPVDTFKKIILKELIFLEGKEEHNNLIIMFPKTDPLLTRRNKVIQALEELGVDYLDQVEDKNRRTSINNKQIRLTTVHSSRGVEAGRTIIFASNLMDLDFASKKINTYILPYIALSRAFYGTKVVQYHGPDFQPSDFDRMLNDIKSKYYSAMEKLI